MLTLSSTRLDTFTQCPMRYHFKYVEGLEPETRAIELSTGSLWHTAMEAYYTCDTPARRLDVASRALKDAWGKEVTALANTTTQIWDEDWAQFDEQLALLTGMLRHYDQVYGHEVIDVLGAEVRFNVPIYKPNGKRAVARFTGLVDLVEERPDGVYLWDHKTVSSFGNSWFAQNQVERQFRRYAWAMEQELGTPIAGFVVNAARKEIPLPPVVNKDGRLSKAKNQNTTYELYVAALADMGLAATAEEYADILEHLKHKGNTYFERDTIVFNRDEVREAGEELYWLYRRMTAKLPPVKTPSPLCTRLRPCPYRVLCVEDTPEARMAFRQTRKELTA